MKKQNSNLIKTQLIKYKMDKVVSKNVLRIAMVMRDVYDDKTAGGIKFGKDIPHEDIIEAHKIVFGDVKFIDAKRNTEYKSFTQIMIEAGVPAKCFDEAYISTEREFIKNKI